MISLLCKKGGQLQTRVVISCNGSTIMGQAPKWSFRGKGILSAFLGFELLKKSNSMFVLLLLTFSSFLLHANQSVIPAGGWREHCECLNVHLLLFGRLSEGLLCSVVDILSLYPEKPWRCYGGPQKKTIELLCTIKYEYFKNCLLLRST